MKDRALRSGPLSLLPLPAAIGCALMLIVLSEALGGASEAAPR